MAVVRIGPINAATPTPIAPDGTFDRDSAKRLCRRWLETGLDGVLLLGSMGEGMYLPDDVRSAFVRLALEEVGNRLTLFVSAADVSRERMKRRALEYARMGAPCVVLCLPPNAPAARAVADVKAVADSCPVPCAYYDIPANTGVPLVLGEIRDILGHGNIVAFKDSSGNDLIAQGLTSGGLRPKDVKLLDGNEYRTAFSAALGYDGVLHGGGALTARWVRAIWSQARTGDLRQAIEADREKALFLAAVYNRFSRPLQNTVGQKYALMLLGCLDSEAVVIDQTLDEASRNRIRAAVDAHRSRL
jgi:dihydrodipicolinate synthase/N-acetylneuraminate lyase